MLACGHFDGFLIQGNGYWSYTPWNDLLNAYINENKVFLDFPAKSSQNVLSYHYTTLFKELFLN